MPAVLEPLNSWNFLNVKSATLFMLGSLGHTWVSVNDLDCDCDELLRSFKMRAGHAKEMDPVIRGLGL